MQIFVVEDSELVRERIVRVITSLPGIQVSGWASDAETATTKILQSHPDVVILDIHLHASTGLTVLDRVKQIKPSPVILVITNYPFPQLRKKYLEHGADYFFDKSTEFDQAIETLKRLLKNSGMSQLSHLQ